MKLEFLIRPIIFKHPGRESFSPEYSAVVNPLMTQYKTQLYFSGATPKNSALNTSQGWRFYILRKL